ncbi:MBL fold metallo-hydrolase [Enterobacter huaxiensis]|uniref:MBL fold metallo-hydrolase n=1 Tax=Enterobacter huaxiensis TaxID=2494702 RepID=UPI0018F4FB22|nr:MBL fold metallo-hydrolase [Enterobacter huaxiensis]
MKTTDQSEVSIWMETLSGNNGHPRPTGLIPSIKTDLKILDPSQDLIVWLGHSSYFVQLAGQRILIDPVFSACAAPLPGVNKAFGGTNLYTAEDIPGIDVLLISHDHYDHLDYPTSRALQGKGKQVIEGLGVGAHFERWGYDMRKVREADWNEVIVLSSHLQVQVTPARHYSGCSFTRDKSLWVGFAMKSSARRLFFSGDSGYGPHFARIGRQRGPFDLVILDAGQYDPRWANVHITPEQAVQAAGELGTAALMQAHVGRFSIASHDWNDPFRRMKVASQGHSFALWTPEIGRPVNLNHPSRPFDAWWETMSADN